MEAGAHAAATAAGGAVLYVRDGCHLCDRFLVDLSLDRWLSPDAVEVVDVDQDSALAARYGLRVPVLVLAGRVVCEGTYDSSRVRDAVQV